jgi:chromosomal replication initiation ATPase DnaA
VPFLAAPLPAEPALPRTADAPGGPALSGAAPPDPGPAEQILLPRQLALPFPHAPHYRGCEFLSGPSNAEALEWLRHTGCWPGGRLALWGPEGCGKTHLLHFWAERHGAARLAGPLLAVRPPEGPVAVDDADAAPERPLLHLLNAAGEAGLPVLLAGRAAPARWRAALPDLASRLRATTAVRIGPAEDELLRSLLMRLLAERQLAVAGPLQDWLRLRLPRSQGAIREAVARLDRAALAGGGRITRALAQAVVAGLDGDPASALPEDDVLLQADTTASPTADRLL